jgi:hypothetical protein
MEFHWEYENKDYKKVKRGSLHFMNFDEIEKELNNLKWIIKEYNETEQINLALNWLPIFKFMNGDLICIDKTDESLKLFDHEIVEIDNGTFGLKLGNNFNEFIENWSKIGFAEIRDWTEVVDENGINLKCEVIKDILSIID